MMFFSEYEHKVNAKNQVTVPARYRAEAKTVFHLMAGKNGCIYMFTEEEIERIVRRLHDDSAASDPAFTRMLYSGIRTVECDPTGRIVLPQELREHAALADAVVFVGVARRVEMWSPARWKEYREKHAESYRARFDGIVEDVFERQR